MTTPTKTATRRRLRPIRSRAAATSISPATARLPAAGPPGRATTSPRSPCRRCWNSRAAHRPRTSRRNCCASSASALRNWRRTASAAPARTNSAPAGRRSARRSKPPSRRRNTPRCNAPRSMPTTRRRRSSAASGEPPNDWAFAGAACWNPAWAPACSSRCCLPALREACQLTGIEYDPITARIARLVHPEARVRCEDYARSQLAGRFDLAIGNPPFSDRVVRADPVTRALGLRLHDYFIARSIARLRPGGIALFVTSTGTMDKASTTAREHIAGMADLVGAVRLPEGSMRASAGTEVVIDCWCSSAAPTDEAPAGAAWIDLAPVESAAADDDSRRHRKRCIIRHPGEPLLRRASGDGAGRACHAARHLRSCPDLHLPCRARTARRLRPC